MWLNFITMSLELVVHSRLLRIVDGLSYKKKYKHLYQKSFRPGVVVSDNWVKYEHHTAVSGWLHAMFPPIGLAFTCCYCYWRVCMSNGYAIQLKNRRITRDVFITHAWIRSAADGMAISKVYIVHPVTHQIRCLGVFLRRVIGSLSLVAIYLRQRPSTHRRNCVKESLH